MRQLCSSEALEVVSNGVCSVASFINVGWGGTWSGSAEGFVYDRTGGGGGG